MFRNSKSQDFFYRVQCSDTETIVLALSAEEAASSGVRSILKKYGEKTELSFIVSVDKITSDSLEIEIFSTPEILADCGFFTLSKKLFDLRDFYLDKDNSPS
jgi:hypothetical protein